MLSVDLFRLFFEQSSDALLAVELQNGKIVGVNPSFSVLSGLEHDELVGESLNILWSSVNHSDLRERRLDTEILSYPGFYNDIYMRSRDGQTRLLSVKVRHVDTNGKTLALAVLSDDTERQLLMRDLLAKHQSMEAAFTELERVHDQLKLSQEKMAQSAKLSALGEMAAGLSHELNQPLTGIRGFAQEILDILKSPKPSKKETRLLCQDIVSNADKMASLLSHFRSFARQEKRAFDDQSEKSIAVDLHHSIDQVTRLIGRRLTAQGIELQQDFDSRTDWQVLAVPYPVEQVLVNLITNSRDALIERMKTAPKSFKPHIRVEMKRHTNTIDIRVSDNGGGVGEKNRNKIFDPFFTTKDPGQGTGLGLSISYGIAHRFGGELVLESSNSNGSTFLLRLPVFENKKKEAA